MENIILIDFSITSTSVLKNICKEIKISFDVLNTDKIKFKFYKVWIDMSSKTMIAYTTQKKPTNMIYTTGFESMLSSISSYQLQPSTDLSDLSLDNILDKISKYGMGSLIKEEKEFLDEVSKS